MNVKLNVSNTCSRLNSYIHSYVTGNCDFDKNTCTWTNTQVGDKFDWTRALGPTSSQGTGPTTDHTSGKGRTLGTILI